MVAYDCLGVLYSVLIGHHLIGYFVLLFYSSMVHCVGTGVLKTEKSKLVLFIFLKKSE